jgi:hypothetical protein
MATDSSAKSDPTSSLLEKILKEPTGIIAVIALVLGGVLSWLGVHLKEDSLKAVAAGAILGLVGLGYAIAWGVRRIRGGAKVNQSEIKGWTAAPPSAAIRGALSFNVHDALPGVTRRHLATKIATSILAPGFRAGVVYGKPGVGKTSLLFAGVGQFLNQRAPRVPVQLVDCRTTTPARLLAAGFEPIAPAAPSAANPNATGAETAAEQVVIIDQFEEWLVPASRTGDVKDIKAYLDYLERAGIRLILGIRYDHAGLISHFLDDTLHVRQSNWELVQPLSTTEAAQIVEECAALDQLQLPKALAGVIARELTHEGVVWPVELQIVLYELLQEPTAEAYQRRGGAAGILSDFIKGTVIRSADPALARDILRLLTTAKDAIGMSVSGLPTYELATLVQELQKLRTGLAEADVVRALDNLSEHRIIGEFRHEGAHSQVPVYRLTHDYLRLVVAKALEEPLSTADSATQLAQTYLLQKDFVSDFEAPLSGLRYAARFGRPEVVNSPAFREMYRLARRRNLKRAVVPPLAGAIVTSVAFAVFAIEIAWDEQQVSPSMQSLRTGYGDVTFDYNAGLARVVGFTGPRLSTWDPDGHLVKAIEADSANFAAIAGRPLPVTANPWMVWRDTERYTFAVNLVDGRKIAFASSLPFFDETTDVYTYVTAPFVGDRLVIARHSCAQATLTVSAVKPDEDMRETDSKTLPLDCVELPLPPGSQPDPARRSTKVSNLQFIWGADATSLAFDLSAPASLSAPAPTALRIALDEKGALEIASLALASPMQELLVSLRTPASVEQFFYQSAEATTREPLRYAPPPGLPVAAAAFVGDRAVDQLLFTKVDAAGLLSVLKLQVKTGRVSEALRRPVGALVPECDGLPASAQIADATADGVTLFLVCNDAKSRLTQRAMVHVPQTGGAPSRALVFDARDKLLQASDLFGAKYKPMGTFWQAQLGGKAVILTPALDAAPVSDMVYALSSNGKIAYVDDGKVMLLDPKTAEAKKIAGGLPADSNIGYLLNDDKLLIQDSTGKVKIVDIGSHEVIDTKAFVGVINKYDPCGSMIAWNRDGSASRYKKVLKVLGATVMSLNSCDAR